MKKIAIILFAAFLAVWAKDIKLSPKEIATWQIKSQKAEYTDRVPLGHFLIEVSTPPSMMRTISLPFKAQVVSLNVALYQRVKKGDLLAEVTGTDWIEAQQKAVSYAIEYSHDLNTYKRKKSLCKEHIIPQKECIAALAQVKTDKIKLSASKALLKSYGASDKIIDDLFKRFKIHRTVPIIAPDSGTIVVMNASLGESTDPSSALFVIQKDGDLWIESDMPNEKTKVLKIGEPVILKIGDKEYQSKVLQIAPILNTQNQTRHVRFALKKGSGLLPGMRTDATVILKMKALKVPKKAVIKLDGKHTVFIDKKSSYEPVAVEIIGEDKKYYYIKPSPKLENPIVVTAVAILKNVAGESDE